MSWASSKAESRFRTRDAFDGLRRAPGLGARIVRDNVAISLMLAATAATTLAILVTIVLPGYTSPMSRLYTSEFGYGSVLRKFDRPFPVTTTRPTRRLLGCTSLGEGLVRSEPIVVPIIPMGTIRRVHIRVGDRVEQGQLLAEVDSTKAQFKVGAARAALETARAELERVRIGSAYVLANERPVRDQIRLNLAEREFDLHKKLQEINLRLADKGYARKQDIIQQELLLTQAQASIREMKFNLGMSQLGASQSVAIAEAAVRDAELALEHRVVELGEHRVCSNAAGRVERCLVHEGEYNQDPGKPGFLLASGSWFEANFDQGAYRRVAVGDRAEVRLEAAPERPLAGRVTQVNPFVSYDLGGPETVRPVRPMGTGSPEWPATFAVRIEVEAPPGVPILPGMTGFASIRAEAEVTCLPREAVFAITAGKALVYLVDGRRFRPREVTIGVIDGDYVEVRDGLGPDDLVIADGHQVLQPGDQICITPEPGAAPDAPPGVPHAGHPGAPAPPDGGGQPVDGGPVGVPAWP